MAHIADTNLSFTGRDVGRLRVVRVTSDPALEPRLKFECEFSLAVRPDTAMGQVALARVTGGLWTFDGKFIVPLLIAEPYVGRITTGGNGYGSFQLLADIGWSRLALFEAAREGKAASFSLRLVYWMTAERSHAEPECPVLIVTIPIDEWCKILEQFGQGRFEVFAIRMTPWPSEATAAALARLQEARSFIERGAFEAAVLACRRSIEAIAKPIGDGPFGDVVKAALSRRLGSKKGDPLGRLVSGLLGLLNLAAHETGAGDFSRCDAEFAVRASASLLALLGDTREPAVAAEASSGA